MHLEEASITGHAALGEGDYRRLEVEAPAIAAALKPGQFVTLRIPGLDGVVLRRPFSVHRVDGPRIAIVYKVVGRGTAVLRELPAGRRISVLGPLGNGFPTGIEPGMTPVTVAGGYGMAPLYFLARTLRAPGHVFIGGAGAHNILCRRDFEALGWQVHVATEDGAEGMRGLVTDALDAWLAHSPSANIVIYGCGPRGMLKAVGERAIARDCRAWLSLDNHMGCGVGACLACVQKVRRDGAVVWARVCKDGPVFEARTIVWDE